MAVGENMGVIRRLEVVDIDAQAFGKKSGYYPLTTGFRRALKELHGRKTLVLRICSAKCITCLRDPNNMQRFFPIRRYVIDWMEYQGDLSLKDFRKLSRDFRSKLDDKDYSLEEVIEHGRALPWQEVKWHIEWLRGYYARHCYGRESLSRLADVYNALNPYRGQ